VVYFGWVRTWSSVYVPSMYPPFADMRVIQGAVRSVERGYCSHNKSVHNKIGSEIEPATCPQRIPQ
jgi:hypothetical protein